MNILERPDTLVVLEAIGRLLEHAQNDTGQSARVADFLLAWHSAEENGGWNPVDLWGLDAGVSADMLVVLAYLRYEHKYLDDIGFEREIAAVWNQRRKQVV